MILKLKLKPNKKRQIVVWIHDTQELEKDIKDVLTFFKDQVSVKTQTLIHKGYKISSTNPAIMLSLHSTILELIAETLQELN